MDYKDLRVERRGAAEWIFINRPERMNAFRGQTCDELIHALQRAAWAREVAVIVLAGSGDKAFCTGGDQSAHEGQYDGRGTIGLPIEELHAAIRDAPKPVIARVQGYAIGGGNVLATLCDLTIASERAVFGQVGPKVGSVDPGYGTALLARVVGEKKAREMWYLCRRYSAAEALAMGLVNAVVAPEQLDAEVQRWCDEISRAQPDGGRDRQALVQHGHRAPGRHRRHGHDGLEAVLRHRRVARGCARLPGKAAAGLPAPRQVAPGGRKDAADRHPGPRRPGRPDRGQPARRRLLRRRPGGPVLRQLRRCAARHAGEFVPARRRPNRSGCAATSSAPTPSCVSTPACWHRHCWRWPMHAR
jgi:2-ketocyclohexanecarboxyl-CoA hydrolase